MVRSIFSNTMLLCIIAIIILISQLLLSIETKNMTWFHRSGSMVVLLGVLISARRIIRLGEKRRIVDWGLDDDTPEGKKVLLDEKAELIYGPFVAVIGTIVWGYGDLLLGYFYS